MSDSKGAAIDEIFDEMFVKAKGTPWTLEGKDEYSLFKHRVLVNAVKDTKQAILALLAQEVMRKLKECLDFGSWLTGHCDLHERYTSACVACQRELRASGIVRDYQDYIRKRLG